MREIAALIVLLDLLFALFFSLRRPSPQSLAWLSVLSGLWLVTNNGVVEGAVLITLNDSHGLTTSDLLGYGGAAVAIGLAARGAPHSKAPLRRVRDAGGCAVLFLLGLALSYFYQPVG